MLFFDDINWDRINRAQAKALVEKEFKRVNKEIPNLLLQSEIFNFIPLSYEGDCGYTCYLGLKKYPNVYAVFEYSLTNITNDVVFQYYIDEKHFINYSIPLHCFFALIHFNDNDKYFSEEYFYGNIKKIVGDIETDRFYISEDISFDKNNAERFLNYRSYVLNLMHYSINLFYFGFQMKKVKKCMLKKNKEKIGFIDFFSYLCKCN